MGKFFLGEIVGKKRRGKKIYENSSLNSAATYSFFLAHLIKYIFYIFFASPMYGIFYKFKELF